MCPVVFSALPAVWGETFGPLLCQNTGSILDPETPFDSPGHESSEYLREISSECHNGVTCQMKGQIFCLLTLLASTGKVVAASGTKPI